jgi:hypothetical protein
MILRGNDILLFRDDLAMMASTSTGYIDKKCSQSRKMNRVTWRSERLEGLTVISYNSLPDQTKSKLPHKKELVNQSKAMQAEKDALDSVDLQNEVGYFIEEKYYYSVDLLWFEKQGLKKNKAYDLSRAAAILRFLNEYKTKTATRKIGFETKKELREAVLNYYLGKIHNPHTHKYKFWYGFKVSNYATLQQRELDWSKAVQTVIEANSNEPKFRQDQLAYDAALASLIPSNFNNQNRRVIGKITNPESAGILEGGRIDVKEYHAAILTNIAMNPGKGNIFDHEVIHMMYALRCKKDGVRPCGLSTVKYFLSEPEVAEFITWERHGFAEIDKVLPHTHGLAPKAALSKGGYDGLSIDFYTKTVITDKLGNEKTGQVMLNVVAVWDYYSEAITGLDIGIVESGEMVRNMYKNHLNTIGKSYIEIESDRFSGNKMDDTQRVFEYCCKDITMPAPNDPKAKASNSKGRFMERMVQELNRLTQHVEGWKGSNITSQKDKNRVQNKDYRGEAIGSFEEAVDQIIKLVNVYNFKELKKLEGGCRWDKMIGNIHPEAQVIDPTSMPMLFNRWTKKQIKNEVLKVKINSKTYEFDFHGYEQYLPAIGKSRTVRIFYDESDMSTVDVYAMADPSQPKVLDGDTYLTTIPALKRAYGDKASQGEYDMAIRMKQTHRRANKTDYLQRKELEVEASLYGIEIGGLPIKIAKEMVEGARATQQEEFIPKMEELYADALARPEAVSSSRYYTDRIVTGRGMKAATVTTRAEKKSAEEKRREFVAKRAERKKRT